MKKNLINEDIKKMMGLIDYDRGKTLTENKNINNKKQLLNEFFPPAILAAAGIGYLASETGIGKSILDGAKAVGNTALSLMGRSANNPAVNKILNANSYDEFFESLNELDAKFQVRKGFLGSKVGRISRSQADKFSEELYEAMDGVGTDEAKIKSVYSRTGTLVSCMRISKEYGKKEGETLTQWLTGDGEYNSVASYLKGKPYLKFNGKNYTDLEDAMVEMLKLLAAESEMEEIKRQAQANEGDWEKNFPCVVNYPKSQQKQRQDGTTVYVIEGEVYFNNGRKKDKDGNVVNYSCEDEIFTSGDFAKLFESYPCVVAEINKAKDVQHPWKGNNDQVYITAENGDILLVSTNGKYVARVGGEKTSGVIECPDDFKLDSGGDELTLSESYYLFEQSFGGITLKPSTPSGGVAGDEEKSSGGGSSSGGSSRTAVTYEDVVAGKGEFKRGDRGDGVKKAQEALNKSDKVNPKLKVDGIFGGKTEAAIKQVGGDKVFNKAVIDMLTKSTGNVASKEDKKVTVDDGEKIDQAEANELDKVTIEKEGTDKATIQDQIADLNQAISQQPTKDECKDLIATAAAGIKAGVKVNDLGSLKQCFNSYNFGLSRSAMKVKRTYGIKGKGN